MDRSDDDASEVVVSLRPLQPRVTITLTPLRPPEDDDGPEKVTD
jgi:hypothetical protein